MPNRDGLHYRIIKPWPFDTDTLELLADIGVDVRQGKVGGPHDGACDNRRSPLDGMLLVEAEHIIAMELQRKAGEIGGPNDGARQEAA